MKFYRWDVILCIKPSSCSNNLFLIIEDNRIIEETVMLRERFGGTILSKGKFLPILNRVEKIGFKSEKRGENLSEWRNPRN